MSCRFPATKDSELIQIVDAALIEAKRKSGDWLACKPGCTQCCVGVFAINALDALRLQRGLASLGKHDRKRAEQVRKRARDSWRHLSQKFPGNAKTGLVNEEAPRFESFGNDEVCPVLDPQTGLCELYEARPITCRVFGPPVRSEDGLGVCELCYQGATEEEIAACEMKPDPEDIESRLVEQVEKQTGVTGKTIVAYCLAR